MKQPLLQPLLIPFTILTYVASILIAIVYRPSSIRYYKGVFELIDSTPNSTSTTIWGRPGAQSWGCRINWFNTTLGLNDAALRVHERIHTLHGEWVNGLAHAVLMPLAWMYLGGWWVLYAFLLAQASFGLSYLVHFLFEWALTGFASDWRPAYRRIWTERIAYRVQAEYEDGKHQDAWGS